MQQPLLCDEIRKGSFAFVFLENPARDDRMAQQVNMHAAKLDGPEFDPWDPCG